MKKLRYQPSEHQKLFSLSEVKQNQQERKDVKKLVRQYNHAISQAIRRDINRNFKATRKGVRNDG